MKTKKELLSRLNELGYNQKTFAIYCGRTEDALKHWRDKTIPLWAWRLVELLEKDLEYSKFIESQKFIHSVMNKYT
jgi:hypothetical protein